MATAVITGASGLLGGNLAVELLAQGHTVRATRRGTTKVAHLEGHAIEWVSADLSDPKALEAAFRGADVVFHCAAAVSIQRKVTPALKSANVDGTRHVIEAVRAAKVPRLVHCSTVGAVGLSEDGRPCTEEAKWNFDAYGMDDGYVTTKHQAEELVHQAVREGLDAVIANPTYMFGPLDSRPSSGAMIVDVALGKVPGRTPGLNNFVDVRDVARGMILVWQKGRRGERYILGGENLPYSEIFERIARLAGAKCPTRNIPRFAARIVGWMGDLSERITGKEPLINSTAVGYGYCTTFIFSSEKAKSELGYAPHPIDGAIEDALAWFRAHGMLPAAP
jgi:dihydroflavonol-4-reductase